MENNQNVPGKGAATASLVLGIIAVVFWFFGYTAIVSVVLGIIGLICAGNAKKAGFDGGLRTAGFVLSLIGLIGGGVAFVACIACAGAISAAGLAIFYMKKAERNFPAVAADGELIFVYGLIGMFIGAKLLFLLTVLPELKDDMSLKIGVGDFLHKYLYAGFVFYGGLYGALLAIWSYAKLTKVQFDLIMQAFLPMLPLIHGFGRLGCFCVGCCYGKASERWGVVFSHSEIAPNGVPLLPVQLIEAAAVFAIFFMLRRMSRQGMDGWHMLGAYLFLYSVARFLLEFLRGDAYRGIFGGVSISQAIAVLSILGSIWLLKKRTGQRA